MHEECDSHLLPGLNTSKSEVLSSGMVIGGTLIDEYILSARLGVDKNESGEHWNNFKEKHLSAFEYNGIFPSIRASFHANVMDLPSTLYKVIPNYFNISENLKFTKNKKNKGLSILF